MSFSAQIATWRRKIDRRITAERREIILRLFRAVVMDTPVDEGTLRGNWQCSSVSPIEGPISKRSLDAVFSEIEQVLNGAKMSDTIFFRNNLPYAEVVEYGLYPNPPKSGTKTTGGFSKKAPAGMVRKNVMRFNRIAEQVKRASQL